MKKVIIIGTIGVLGLLFINFVLGHIILFVVNNFLPILLVAIVAVICLRRHDRKRSGVKK